MLRLLTVSLVLAFFVSPTPPQGTTAVELTLYEQGDVSRWLCEALNTSNPGDRLKTFPGAQGGEVNHYSKEAFNGHTIALIWLYETAETKLNYNYGFDKDEKAVSGYAFSLEAKSGEKKSLFRSQDAATKWVRQFGGGCEPLFIDPTDDVVAAGTSKDEMGYCDFQVEASFSKQEVLIFWKPATESQLAKLCSSP